MKKFLVDTFVMILFSTIFGMFTETLIAGMTLAQSLQSRITAVPVNLLTARPYGIFRDWIFYKAKSSEKDSLKNTAVDIVSFVSFQVPIYAIILIMSGANTNQSIISCSTITLFSVFIGRPYGICLDFFRKIFKVE
jgi:hypothetical protein